MSIIPNWENPLNINIPQIFHNVAVALRETLSINTNFTPEQMAPMINSIVPFSGSPRIVEMEYPTEGLMQIQSFEPSSEKVLYKMHDAIINECNDVIINGYTIPANAGVDYITIGPKISEVHNLYWEDTYNSCPVYFSQNCNNLVSISNMFRMQETYNYPLNFKNTPHLKNLYGLFLHSVGMQYSFNQPLIFPDIVQLPSYLNEYIFSNTSNSFRRCISFNQPINFQNFATGNAENMFAECYSFNQPLYIPNNMILSGNSYYTDNFEPQGDYAGSMRGMFSHCENLNSPITFNIHTRTATTSAQTYYPIRMDYMFAGCYNLNQPLYFTSENIIVNSLIGVFAECNNLNTTVVFNNCFTRNYTELFRNCQNLRTIQWINMFDAENTDDYTYSIFFGNSFNFSNMFENCYNFNSSINVDYIRCNNSTSKGDFIDFSSMFCNCENYNSPMSILHSNYYNSYKRRYPVNLYMNNMFINCYNLNQPIIFPSNNANAIIRNMSWMFYGCENFNQILEINCQISGNAESAFEYCTKLQSVILNPYEECYITTGNNMFHYCTNLQYFNFRFLSTYGNHFKNAVSMFEECNNLIMLNQPFPWSKYQNASRIFYNCTNLQSGPMNRVSDNNCIDLSWAFYNCSNLILTSPFNFAMAENLQMINGMFANMKSNIPSDIYLNYCPNLIGVDSFIAGYDSSKRINIHVNDVNNCFNKIINVQSQGGYYTSITGTYISWTPFEYGVYYGNIYVYNNI